MRRGSAFVQIVSVLLGLQAVTAQAPPAAPPPGPAGSQDSARPQQPTFRVDINFVEVDAVVTNAQGEFVRTLGRDDFEVLEDGKPQHIETFMLVDVPVDRRERPLFKSEPVEPDVFSNRRPFDGRLFLLVLDDIHTNALRSLRVKKAARQFIEQHLGANDLAAVAFTSGRTDGAQEFTGSRRLLLQAVDKFMGRKIRSATLERIEEYQRQRDIGQTPGSDASRRINDPLDFERGYNARSALETLTSLSEALADVRGRRKALVFFSEGIDYDILDVFGSTQATTVMDAARSVIAAASRANVTIYSVDPRGLTTMADESMEISALPEDTSLNLGPQTLYTELRRAQDSLQVLSEQTGGFASLSSNEFANTFDRIITDNSAYYLIGYYPQNDRRDGRYRRIEVRVRPPGLQVRSRKGYSAARGKAPAPPSPPRGTSVAVQRALESALPASGLVLAVSPAVFRGAGTKGSVVLTTQVDGAGLKFESRNGQFLTQLELATVAADVRGKVPAWEPVKVDLRLQPRTHDLVSKVGVRIVSRMDLEPGRYQIRVAGHDTGSGLAGSVHAYVEVPDFRKNALSMSDLVLTSPLAAVVPTPKYDEELKALLPTPPTVARTFSGTEELTVFTEVYDNDTAAHKVDITTSVRADDGREVFKDEEERASSELGGKTGGYGVLVKVPLENLADGPHVLRVEARSRLDREKTAAREVEFVVVRPARTPPASDPAGSPPPTPPRAGQPAGTTGMTATSLVKGTHSGIETPRQVFVRTREEWRALWQQHQPGTEPPPVDFSKQTVVGVFLGERTSGGYDVEILRVTRSGEAVSVEYLERSPAPDQMTAQVMTSPFHLVVIGNVTARTATFRRLDAAR